jgi:hypothetical protein
MIIDIHSRVDDAGPLFEFIDFLTSDDHRKIPEK